MFIKNFNPAIYIYIYIFFHSMYTIYYKKEFFMDGSKILTRDKGRATLSCAAGGGGWVKKFIS